MSETFDHAATNPASGGENLAGDRFSQAGSSLFLPAAYLVFGPADGPFTRVDSAAGLPVAVQNASLAVAASQAGAWTVGVSGSVGIRALSYVGDSVAAYQAGTWQVLQQGLWNVSAILEAPSGTQLTSHALGSARAIDVCLLDAAGNRLAAFPVTDNAGSLTVDDGDTSLSIDDGGGSLTVDGTISVSGTVTVDSELPAAVTLADALANPTTPLTGACQLLWSGSGWDRRPGTVEAALLASASRNATTSSATQTNYGARGVIIWLDLSVFNGGTGLALQIWAVDPVSGRAGCLAAWGPRSATAQVHWLELSPGGGGGAGDVYGVRVQGALPRHWFVTVSHTSATAHTYGVSCSLLP